MAASRRRPTRNRIPSLTIAPPTCQLRRGPVRFHHLLRVGPHGIASGCPDRTRATALVGLVRERVERESNGCLKGSRRAARCERGIGRKVNEALAANFGRGEHLSWTV